MKTTKIYYKRLFAMQGYNNKEVGIEFELEPGETETEALDKAISFINKQDPEYIRDIEEKKLNDEISNATQVMKNPHGFTLDEFIEAAKKIYDAKVSDLPF